MLEAFPPTGIFMGLGLVPWNLITTAGKADTTTQPTYPYPFAKDSSFAGTLSLQINHILGYQSGIRYYRLHVGSSIRLQPWLDLKLNLANGKYEIPVPFQPMVIAGQPGFYSTLFINQVTGL